jgi:hypothetical protein
MAELALKAAEVANVVQFVAPGFFARVAYGARFPQPEASTLTTLVWSIAASLPLVAVGNSAASRLGVTVNPTEAGYVLLLLGLASLAGYATAGIRAIPRVRFVLGRVGLHHQPDGSVYAMTMLAAPSALVVVIEMTDGRLVSGTPRFGPSFAEDGINELVLTHPEWKSGDSWSPDGAGAAVLLPLSQVKTVTFSSDPFESSRTPKGPRRTFRQRWRQRRRFCGG